MKKPFVISISGISGSGKTTVTITLKERLPNSAVISFDDYGERVYLDHDINDWSADTNDDNEWHVEPIATDIERLLNQSMDYIILDYPFGYRNECVGKYINLAVFVDTPLDVALARRLLRDWDEADTKVELQHYLSRSRQTYARMPETQKPASDLIVDGTKTPEEISSKILEHLKEHKHYES